MCIYMYVYIRVFLHLFMCSYMYLLIHICVHMFGIAPSNFREENARLSHSHWNSWAHPGILLGTPAGG